MTNPPPTESDQVTPREILRLAIPALGALLAQPLFLLADTAIVGHLGTAQLAGLGVAGTILGTVVGLAIFLAFGTTAAVARELGAGRLRVAVALGLDALWLATAIGVMTAAALWWAAPSLIHALGLDPTSLAGRAALEYLRVGVWGMPAMLIVLASTGIVRGLQNTTVTLVVAVAGALVNIPLNFILVYGWWGIAPMGLAGSALGTVIAQCAMAAAFLTIISRHAHVQGVSLRPHLGGISATGRGAWPLFVRSLCLRGAIIAAVAVVGRFGESQLAAFQIALTIWMLFSYLLDALEVAAQALVGRQLGAKNYAAVRGVMRILQRWSVVYGTALAIVVCGGILLWPAMFSADPAVQNAVRYSVVVIALAQPMCGYVYALDGVLVGAGDNKYLGRAMLLSLLGFAPLLGAIVWLQSHVAGDSPPWGLLLVLIAYAFGFMGLRAVTQWWRVRTDVWMHDGARPQ